MGRTRRFLKTDRISVRTRTQVSYHYFDRISLSTSEIRLSDINWSCEIGQGEIVINYWVSITLLTSAWHSSARRSMTKLMRKKHDLVYNEFSGISSTLTWNLIRDVSWTSWISAWRSVAEKWIPPRDVVTWFKSDLSLCRHLDSWWNSCSKSVSHLDPYNAYEDLDSCLFFFTSSRNGILWTQIYTTSDDIFPLESTSSMKCDFWGLLGSETGTISPTDDDVTDVDSDKWKIPSHVTMEETEPHQYLHKWSESF